QILDTDPTDVDANRLLAEAHERLRRQSATDLVQRAETALAADRWPEARQHYQGALELVPGLVAAGSGLQGVERAGALARRVELAPADVVGYQWDAAAVGPAGGRGVEPRAATVPPGQVWLAAWEAIGAQGNGWATARVALNRLRTWLPGVPTIV